ncbi:TadE/TadG family type IV pilus assembly protein [Pelagovum pacificum]|uniref:Pilus assembly protein n=1 Tax=Pelagovum pacificum TaxID=2588711 RepID=A0A5C5GEM8_9RHOB|nr:hypothetical protein [Pelagovum pacificum]QQA43678.1 hypothetical protein I8N54_03625 [Pelagovum pacificum]TNY33188.1 hypothetical protein FHY64_07905 [Pelagovum pacificum]
MILRFLMDGLRRLLREERGSIAVESVLILPILTWCYAGTFVYFDAFRAESINAKATYAIADIMSRETELVPPTYFDSLLRVHRLMTFAQLPTRLRVSVLEWDDDRKDHEIVWSVARGDGGINPMTDAELGEDSPIAAKMPNMLDGEKLIVVESWLPYEPVFNVGLGGFVFEGFTVTRPRYAPQVCYDPGNTGDVNDALC